MPVTPNNIITPQTVATNVLRPSAANTDFVGGNNAFILATAGPNGARVTRVWAIPTVTIAAEQVQLFFEATGGVVSALLRCLQMPAFTLTTAALVPKIDFGFSDANPLILAPLEKLKVGIGVLASGPIWFRAEWQNF